MEPERKNNMKNRIKLYRMTAAALLMALVILLGMTPLGLIPLGFINVTILAVPVIIGAILLGMRSGLLLGFCFGTVSTLSMLGLSLTPPSALASALFAQAPLLAVIMCYAPRLLVPLVACGAYKLLAGRKIAVPAAAVLASLTNTVVYLGLMLVFYMLCGLDSAKILSLIAGTGLIAGACEALAAALISTPVAAALSKTKIGAKLY